jgi:hypothetical protein
VFWGAADAVLRLVGARPPASALLPTSPSLFQAAKSSHRVVLDGGKPHSLVLLLSKADPNTWRGWGLVIAEDEPEPTVESYIVMEYLGDVQR